MQKLKLKVDNMSCAACVHNVHKAVLSCSGVSSVKVNLFDHSANIEFDNNKCSSDNIIEAIKKAGYNAYLFSDRTKFTLNTDKYNLIATIIFTVILLCVSMLPMLGVDLALSAKASAYIQLFLTLAIFYCSHKLLIAGVKSVILRSFNMDSLVAIGSLASFIYSCISLLRLQADASVHLLHTVYPLYFESAACIICFVSIGKFIEQKLKHKSSSALESLLSLRVDEAIIEVDNNSKTIPALDLKIGDKVILKAGMNAPCDGVVISGYGLCNQSKLTGESVLIKKQVGDQILSASSLVSGYLVFEASAVGENSTYNKIINLVDEALATKAPIAKLADSIAAYFVPAIFIISVLSFLGHYLYTQDINIAFNFALSVLVVSCPCALGLATPAAIISGFALSSRFGILFKNTSVIELLAKINTVVFDKTGTLTYGNMQIIKVFGADSAKLASYTHIASSLEALSSHPIAKAFSCDKKLFTVSDFKELALMGIEGSIFKQNYKLLNIKGLEHYAIAVDNSILTQIHEHIANGYSVVALCHNQEFLCAFVLGDSLRADSKYAIEQLHKLGCEAIILTGDNEQKASSICKWLGIKIFEANMLPDAKALYVKNLQESKHRVLMVGDGVNDAAALSYADVGISLAGASDIALNSAQVILLDSRLSNIVKAINISRKILVNIKQNLFWAFVYNIICIPIAAGLFYYNFKLSFNPMLSAALMSLSSIFVVLNAARLSLTKSVSLDFNKRGIMINKQIMIEGMSCSHCTSAVHKALEAIPGIEKVDVSLEQKCANISCDEALDNSILQDVIESLNFKVTAIK